MGSLAPPDQQSASIRKRASATLADLHSSLEQRGGDFDEEDLLSSYASPLSHRTSTAKMNGRIVEDDYEDLISHPLVHPDQTNTIPLTIHYSVSSETVHFIPHAHAVPHHSADAAAPEQQRRVEHLASEASASVRITGTEHLPQRPTTILQIPFSLKTDRDGPDAVPSLELQHAAETTPSELHFLPVLDPSLNPHTRPPTIPHDSTTPPHFSSSETTSLCTSDPRRYSSEAPDPEKTAPWQTPDALAPMVYMDKETGEMKRVGKVEEMVLPAVARRLEAERIAKLMQGGGGDDGEEEGLVTGWGKDGMPRVIDPWNRRQSRDGGNTRPATAVVVEDNQQLPSPPPTPPTVELEKRKQQEEVRNEGVAALPAPVVIKGPTRSSSLRKRGRRQSTQPPPPPAGAAPPDHQYTFNFPPPPPSPVVGKKGKKQASEDAHGGGCCGCVVS
ncbi:hypothetical protein MNV49_000208 [Pseudohyphozyma bogoriensis]|nr:hypothetical protein MNV49_000208 [Pseudohyphozyma bogoriensis]